VARGGQALLGGLDATLPQASGSWRDGVLRKIADLFVSGAEFYTAEQVTLFDAVIDRLIVGMDSAQLAELSRKLAPIDNAPAKVIGSLARHADVAVCGPILEQATALADVEIVKIASDSRVDADRLAKIAARRELSAAVTDALLARGGKAIQHTIIAKQSAQISEAGFARVIMGLNGDKDLAAATAARNDVPPELRLWLAKVLDPQP